MTVEIPMMICPDCDARNDCATAVGAEEHRPENGDVVVCSTCGLLSFVVDVSTGECRAAKDQKEFEEAVVDMLNQLTNDVSFGVIAVDRRTQRVRLWSDGSKLR